MEKNVIRCINDYFRNFSSSDGSGESDEEQIKAVQLMLFEYLSFEGAISKMSFFFNTRFITFQAFTVKDF